MDDKQRDSFGNFVLLIFVITYACSLANIAITHADKRYIGWEVLLVGGFQTVAGFQGIVLALKTFSLQMLLGYLLMTLP